MSRVLFLSPHTDDVELACGSTLVHFLETGHEVFLTTFSICRDSIPDDLPQDILKREQIKSAKILGIKNENRIILDYQVRTFRSFRQKILDDMIRLRSKIQPDIVFTPCSYDNHQDHQTIHQESIRAYKNSSSILGYSLPWNNIGKGTFNFIFPLQKRHVLTKIEALTAYESQVKLNRVYFSKQYQEAILIANAVNVNVNKFAEAFECILWKAGNGI